MSILRDAPPSSSSASAAASSSSEGEVPPGPPAPTKEIDLRSCPPEELATWLLVHRFEDDAMEVASFLLNCTSALPNAEEISARLLGGGGGGDDDDDGEEEEEEEAGEDEGGEGATPTAEPVEPAAVAAATEPAAAAGDALLSSVTSSPRLPSFQLEGGGGDVEGGIEVSCIAPRGKFLLQAHRDGMVLVNPKKDEERVPIAKASPKHVVWFRKPEDCRQTKQLGANGGSGKKKGKGTPGHAVLIRFDGNEGAPKFRGKTLEQVCFQLPPYPADDGAPTTGPTEGDWWKLLSLALVPGGGSTSTVRVRSATDPPARDEAATGRSVAYAFRSEGASDGGATTTEGMPYVSCHRGFHDGALFPLREGLLFFKPPLFVPRSHLASISCGRGSGSSRYVDMVVQLHATEDDEGEGSQKKKKNSDTLEFTNIHRDELTGLNDYIHKVLIPEMQRDANGAGEASGDDGTDDSDEDESDAIAEVVDGGSDDEEEEREGPRKRRPSRAASRAAREVTRAALRAAPTGGDEEDDTDDDSEMFEEEDADSSDSDAEDDGDSDESDSEGDDDLEEEEDDEDSEGDEEDGDYNRKSKKARMK
ncbi:hypothetical protein ACHAWF_014974 [Thalassiosira exigua]